MLCFSDRCYVSAENNTNVVFRFILRKQLIVYKNKKIFPNCVYDINSFSLFQSQFLPESICGKNM